MLTVNINVKGYMWYRVMLKLLRLLAVVKIVNAHKCLRIALKLLDKGTKFRIGEGKWRRLSDSNVHHGNTQY